MGPFARAALAASRFVVVAALLQACARPDDPTDPGGSKPGPGTDALTVTLSTRQQTLPIGGSTQLSARVTDGTGLPVDRAVAWRSTESSVATVTSSGVVTGVAAGSARIVASVGTAADTATVVVIASAPAYVVLPNVVSAVTGDELQFTVTNQQGVAAAGETVTWTSSDPAVATVSSTGLLSTLGEGDAVVTASVGGETATASITVKGTTAVSITLSPTNTTLNPGQTVRMEARVSDDNRRTLPNRKITWASSDPAVATVGSDGVVTSVTKGVAIISGRSDNLSATATINVLGTPAAGVSVALGASTVGVGQTTTATATVRDASGTTLTDKVVAWQSSNPAVATVNSSGLVTGIAAGSATISAIADGQIGNASLTIAALTAASVAISPGSPTAMMGQSAQLTAVARDASGNVLPNRPTTWSSANPSVATISATGVASALAVGTSTITAVVDGKSATATFTVTSVPVTNVAIQPSQLQLAAGASATLTATASSNGQTLTDRPVSWSSSNPTVATVSSAGAVTGVSAGSATITASVEGVTATVPVSVSAPPPAPVASVTVTLGASTVSVGQGTTATAVLRDAAGNLLTGRTVSWSSANPTLATVSSNGTITTIAAGSATITATSEGQTGAATLTIAATAPAPVASVTLTLAPTSVLVGQTSQATVVLRDASGNVLSGRTIAMSSSNQTVALVNASGVVTGAAAGSATISATSEGKTGGAPIGVTASSTPAPVATVSVALASGSLSVGQTTQATATLKDAGGNTLTGRSITWTTSNPLVATVSSGGLVTATGAGSAQIVATSEGKQGSGPVTVTAPVAPPPPPTNFVEQILGVMPSVSTITALGGVYAKYESDFTTYDEPQWTECQSGKYPMWNCDYYDRAAIYYARWKRTGDAKYLDRANRMALSFRTQYLEPANYGLAHHWAMMDGVALHYLATGDPKSLKAVGAVADVFSWLITGGANDAGYITDAERMDNRIQAYFIKSLLLAYVLKAPSNGVPELWLPGNNDFAALLRKGLNAILATRDADGQWRGAKCGAAGRGSHPFTVGLLYDALIRYYTMFEADPRIPQAIKQSADVMWRDDWVPAGVKYPNQYDPSQILTSPGAFKYVGIDCPGEGGPTPAPDLNQLIVNGYGFIGRTLGDATFKQRAEEIFAGGVNGRGVTGDTKHFNQQYTSALRYLSMR